MTNGSAVPIGDDLRSAPPARARCRFCGVPIVWGVTEAGKKIPLDPVMTERGNVDLMIGHFCRVVGKPDGRLRHYPHHGSCTKYRRK